MSGASCQCGNATCDCCAGIERITPEATANRPGLSALAYRVGTHATFLETMKARLSNLSVESTTPDTHPETRPLQGLTTREADDPAIALLDGWAMVADVLTFYQERIANEGYLRTALERRSVLELARLVGYKMRPGVASTVYLAYTVDEKHPEPVEIPVGARSQSVPVLGELPQSFETVEKLVARAAWNTLKPRMTSPQTFKSIAMSEKPRIYLKGIATNLKANDPVLIDFGDGQARPVRVREVVVELAANRTLVKLQPFQSQSKAVPASRVPAAELQFEAARRLAAEVQAVTERHLTVEAERLNVSTRSEMYQRIERKLREFQANADQPETELLARLQSDVLPSITQEEAVAADNPRYSRLRSWLSGLSQDLQVFVERVRTARAERAASAFAIAATTSAFAESADVLPIEPRAAMTTSMFRKGDDVLQATMSGLIKPATMPPPNEKRLARSGATTFQAQADTGLQIASAFNERVSESLAAAIANAKSAADNPIKFYALRTTARLFGHNSPLKAIVSGGDTKVIRYEEWAINNPYNDPPKSPSPPPPPPSTPPPPVVLHAVAGEASTSPIHSPTILSLDAEHAINRDSWLVYERQGADPRVMQLSGTRGWIVNESIAGYGLSGKSSRLLFANAVEVKNLIGTDIRESSFGLIRASVIHAQSEQLELAEEPLDKGICGGENDLIELDGIYNDLKAGRWLIVSGERADINSQGITALGSANLVSGVRSSELVMLAEVIHTVEEIDSSEAHGDDYGGKIALPGDRTHTYIRLATKLEYCYKRDTVTIYGNVVKATHGETRTESLGNGDGSKALQTFALKQKPLTFLAAPTPVGAESTLKVYVNDVEWHEVDGLAELSATDRKFVTKTDDDDKTSVIFGNGRTGARLPTGIENVKAVYRNGIGRVGNVKAGQISLLMTRPLGVKEVINPLRASGGADRETLDQARRNAPLTVTALDRLVSVQDYEDFARVFAGIGKASATWLSNGQQELVHLTIAGSGDIPIEASSDLYRNLVRALRDLGEPHQRLQVEMRELALLVISARVRPQPDYVWEPLVTKMRAKLLDTFSFEKRELGQDALLSEALAAMHAVPGVAHVDVDVFGSVSERIEEGSRPRTPQEITQVVQTLFAEHEADRAKPSNRKRQPKPRVGVNMADSQNGRIRPAQIAFLSPAVPDTLILNPL